SSRVSTCHSKRRQVGRRTLRARAWSEQQFQGHLQDTRIAGAGDRAERGRRLVSVRGREIHAVQNVESLGAVLQPDLLGQRKIFEQAEVKRRRSRSAHDITARVPESANPIGSEGGGVEILLEPLRERSV